LGIPSATPAATAMQSSGGASSVPAGQGGTAPVRPSEYPCSYEGEIHQPGDIYPAADGCNKCSCSDDGTSSCSENGCLLDPDDCARASGGPWSVGAEGALTIAGSGTTVCVLQESRSRICFHGTTAEPADGSEGGGGVALIFSGLQFGVGPPFDAAALGAVGIRFGIYGIVDFEFRPSFTMLDDPNVADDGSNFEANPFVSSVRPEINTRGTFELRFDELAQPQWSQLDLDGDGTFDRDTPFDPSNIKAFQVLMVPERGSEYYFEFCLADVAWFDEERRPISP